ncbi:hypothetical protein M011DRAFT_459361 [Sporormia fimetaria CBS 119925]|uniref:Uncharacterized protein n=1 Tax=Sporormia fimetaria CBS 119925 TaxID=1340428 RepID=A0A6A6V6I2_9PLEO|nr:hypothetical protein M011DRAFT_459361 [Sporormia fimetaria CBS 119925]
MDAKPQRPVRAVRIRDENAAPQALGGKVIHQRNKSTPALVTLAQPAQTKALMPKRTAFADVSNTVRQPVAKDDLHMHSKSTLADVLKDPAIVSAKEVKSTALLRPAQRPLAPATTTSKPNTTSVTASAPVANAGTNNIRKILAKKATTVFKESSAVASVEYVDPCLKPASASSGQAHNDRHKAKATKDVEPVVVEVEEDYASESAPAVDIYAKAVQHQGHATTERSDQGLAKKASKAALHREHDVSDVEAQERYEYLDALEEQAQAIEQEHNEELAKAQAMIHAEEYWEEEEEEEYYEADGYTTARSLRSRGDNTTGGVTLVLAPRVTAKIQRELEAAKTYVNAHKTVEDLEDEQWDTSMVAEYGEEIYEYMHELEDRMKPNPTYMDNQSEIQWSMRSVLMDWLVQVHNRFTLLPETLFLSVNYVDRFLSCKVVSLGKLQLVGATALFVAAKYEEINCPSVQEIVYMVDGAYTVDEILKAERFMLSMLHFELGWPGPMSFLRRISKADDYDLETRTLAKYFLEITLMDERFVGCAPSFLAAGAHCLARYMLKKGDWSQAHVHYSGYTLAQLRQLVSVILECCENPQKHHAAVYEKYTDKRYKRASIFVENEIAHGFQLLTTSRDSFPDHSMTWKRK